MAVVPCDRSCYCQSGDWRDAAVASFRVEKPIAYWVSQLGNDHYLRREMASKKLIEAGPPAIEDLVKVIDTGDLEVVERATHVIAEIAFARPPRDDGGAWDQLQLLADARGRPQGILREGCGR